MTTESQTPPAEAGGQTPAATETLPVTTPEAKPEDQEPPKAEAPAGAPEAYADFVIPEGVEVDAGMIDAFKPVAKELNLSQEQAQKLAEFYASKFQEGAKAQEAQQAENVRLWDEAIKSDPEFGGSRLEATKQTALKAVSAFGSPELVDLFNTTWLGSHPEIVKAFARAGKAISEDRFHQDTKTGSQKTLAERMYPPK